MIYIYINNPQSAKILYWLDDFYVDRLFFNSHKSKIYDTT